LISVLAEDLLKHYTDKPLVDRYDVYQHLMDYWRGTMQDDCYLIASDGWKAETTRIIETDKKGKEIDKGWTCDLIPKPLIVARYYAKEQADIDALTTDLEAVITKIAELEEEHGGEEGAFSELDKVNKASVAARLKELKSSITNPQLPTIGNEPAGESGDELAVLETWLKLSNEEADLKRRLKECEAELDAKAYTHYPKLTEAEIKTLVVDDKWLAALSAAVHGEVDRVSQSLTQRAKELAERYDTPLSQMTAFVDELEEKVNYHLERMGFAWK
jgi:type I restriction enzyme M protein